VAGAHHARNPAHSPRRTPSLGKQARDESGKHPVNEDAEEFFAGSRMAGWRASDEEHWSRHSGAMQSIEPQMRNCASGNLEIPGLVLRTIPE
jgi:hypothetical protein